MRSPAPLDLVVASTGFVWILPPLYVGPVREDGVEIKDKVDGVVAIRFDVTGTNLRDEVRVNRVFRQESYR